MRKYGTTGKFGKDRRKQEKSPSTKIAIKQTLFPPYLFVCVPYDDDGGLVLVNPVEECGQGHSVLIGGVS